MTKQRDLNLIFRKKMRNLIKRMIQMMRMILTMKKRKRKKTKA